jgi:hypothetical protein
MAASILSSLWPGYENLPGHSCNETPHMNSYLHLLSLTNALVSWTAIYLIFIRPHATGERLLKLLIAPHLFRYLGLIALMNPLFPVRVLGFSDGYLALVAWGDFTAGVLALAALVALHRKASFAMPLVWLFNIVGLADFANAGLQMAWPLTADPTAVGPLGWIVLTIYFPMLIISHLAMFELLIRHRASLA